MTKETKMSMITLKLPLDLKINCKVLAAEKNMSISEYIRLLIEHEVRYKEDEEKHSAK